LYKGESCVTSCLLRQSLSITARSLSVSNRTNQPAVVVSLSCGQSSVLRCIAAREVAVAGARRVISVDRRRRLCVLLSSSYGDRETRADRSYDRRARSDCALVTATCRYIRRFVPALRVTAQRQTGAAARPNATFMTNESTHEILTSLAVHFIDTVLRR